MNSHLDQVINYSYRHYCTTKRKDAIKLKTYSCSCVNCSLPRGGTLQFDHISSLTQLETIFTGEKAYIVACKFNWTACSSSCHLRGLLWIRSFLLLRVLERRKEACSIIMHIQWQFSWIAKWKRKFFSSTKSAALLQEAPRQAGLILCCRNET